MKQYVYYFFLASFFFLVSMAGVSAKNDESERSTGSNSSGSKIIISEKDKGDDAEDKKRENEGIKITKDTQDENSSGSISTERYETEKKKAEIKLKRDINTYIIESYKAQGNKIIKDLSIKLTKTIPEPEERKVAYEKIQDSLKSRLEKTEENEGSSSKKEILQEFLRHLITLLDKKIDEIEK